MSLHEYLASQQIAVEDHPFYALIMAAMRQPTPTTARSSSSPGPTSGRSWRAATTPPAADSKERPDG